MQKLLYNKVVIGGENMEEIATLISSVGFPIAACVVMFYQNGKLQQTLAEISTTMSVLTERIKDIETKIDCSKEDKNGKK